VEAASRLRITGSGRKAKDDAKAKIDQAIAEMRTDYERRSGKLKQAWELTKEALT
jgi:hypothetical protein